MKSILFIFLLSGFVNLSLAQPLNVVIKYVGSDKKNTISYSPDVKLKWEDFKAAPVASSNAAAVTMSGFSFKMNYSYSDSEGELIILVTCYFSKNESWGKPGKKTEHILNHEQHHFDITYIQAMNFMNNLKKEKITSQNYSAVIQQKYKEAEMAMRAMQDEYDRETENSKNYAAQEKWDEKIVSLLPETS